LSALLFGLYAYTLAGGSSASASARFLFGGEGGYQYLVWWLPHHVGLSSSLSSLPSSLAVYPSPHPVNPQLPPLFERKMSTAPAAPPSTANDSTATLTTASSSAQTMSTAVSSQKLHDPYKSALNPLDRVIDTGSGRILCIADIRGDYKRLNKLVEEHDAVAVIHTGDFGFLDGNSPSRMASR
jgi:hypothetical protein